MVVLEKLKTVTNFLLILLTVKYRHPAAFFNSNVRLNTLIQALDGIPNHFLEVPEGCHLHPNVEVCILNQ